MKTNCLNSRPNRAYMLFEALVYIGVVVVVLGVAYLALDRSIRASVLMRRAAGDVTLALQAGERWRADVRASSQVGWEQENGDRVLRLQTARGIIGYRFESNAVFRRGSNGAWSPVLTNVNLSEMKADPREKITAWCWELELQPRAKQPRTRPLFTFLAVPARGGVE